MTPSFHGLPDAILNSVNGLPARHDPILKRRRRASLCESKRRALMNRLFLSLRSTVPDLASITDRCNVIDKTCDYMKRLEKELGFLRKKASVLSSIAGDSEEADGCHVGKDQGQICTSVEGEVLRCTVPESGDGDKDAGSKEKSRDCKRTLRPHVQVMCCGNSSSLNIEIGCCERNRSGLFPSLLHIFESIDLEVLSANRSQRMQTVMYVIHVKASHRLQRKDIKKLRSLLYARVCKTMAAPQSI